MARPSLPSSALAALGLALLSSCAARNSNLAVVVLDSWPMAAGWAPCHAAPGPCTAKLTLGTDQQSAAGFCYEVVAKAPGDADPFTIEVYTPSDPAAIASSEGRGNPVKAGFCMTAPEDAEPLELVVYSMERVPAGASVAVFRQP